VHWAGPLAAVQEVARRVPRKAAVKVVKPAKLTGEQFYDQWMAAIKAMREVHGDAWHLRPKAWQWCTLPAKLTHLTTAIVDDGAGGKRGGVKLKWSKGQKLPAARYWAGGVLPAAVVVDVLPPPTVTPWVDDGRGYEVHPMLLRLEAARADQIAADKPVRLARQRREAVDKAKRELRNVLSHWAFYDRDKGRSTYYPDRWERAAKVRRELAAELAAMRA
jgi:hypothetical protein